jgi:hypothetical protein
MALYSLLTPPAIIHLPLRIADTVLYRPTGRSATAASLQLLLAGSYLYVFMADALVPLVPPAT